MQRRQWTRNVFVSRSPYLSQVDSYRCIFRRSCDWLIRCMRDHWRHLPTYPRYPIRALGPMRRTKLERMENKRYVKRRRRRRRSIYFIERDESSMGNTDWFSFVVFLSLFSWLIVEFTPLILGQIWLLIGESPPSAARRTRGVLADLLLLLANVASDYSRRKWIARVVDWQLFLSDFRYSLSIDNDEQQRWW